MKGIIFNLLEDFITDQYGEEQYDNLITQCKLSIDDPGVIVGPGTYPDEDLMTIMNQASDFLGCSYPDLLRGFGRYALPKLTDRYPQFFSPYDHPKDFLKTVGFIHHIEIVKLYKDAETPGFDAQDPSPDRLTVKYSSGRRLCYFLEGLIEGLAVHYNVPIEHTQTQCIHDGADQCLFDLEFAGENGY